MEKRKLHGGKRKATASAGILPARCLSAATEAAGEGPGSGKEDGAGERRENGVGEGRQGLESLKEDPASKDRRPHPFPRCRALTRW